MRPKSSRTGFGHWWKVKVYFCINNHDTSRTTMITKMIPNKLAGQSLLPNTCKHMMFISVHAWYNPLIYCKVESLSTVVAWLGIFTVWLETCPHLPSWSQERSPNTLKAGPMVLSFINLITVSYVIMPWQLDFTWCPGPWAGTSLYRCCTWREVNVV